jgi:hypothetical protein
MNTHSKKLLLEINKLVGQNYKLIATS